MIAVDTNILVYAHRQDSEWHPSAARVIRGLAEGTSAWAIPWPCVHEFLAVATHPRIFRRRRRSRRPSIRWTPGWKHRRW